MGSVQISITSTPCGGACYVFTANGVPKDSAQYSYFWFFDDGSYEITTVNSVSHTFQGPGGSSGMNNRNVQVEVTKLYEKGDKPTRAFTSVPINSIDEIQEPKSMATPLTLIPNRTPVPGDSITYVVSYGMPCEGPKDPTYIEISFDSDKLTYDDTKTRNFHSETITDLTGGKIRIQLSNSSLPNNLARRVFLTFEVKSTVQEEETVGIDGEIFFAEEQTCPAGTVSATAVAALSHDPNYIVANQKSLCAPVATGDKMTYTIHFQNIGAGTANEVVVRTYLPLFFSTSSVQTVYPAGMTNPTPVNNREIVWNLSGTLLKGGSGLKGTGDPDYGTLFGEEATMDSIQFVVEFDDAYFQAHSMDFDPCLAIINRAEITFDCNPPIFTNFYHAEIACPGSVVGGTCTCAIIADSAYTSATYSGTPILLGNPSSAPGAIWYPPVFISDPFATNPTVSPPRAMDYMAVVRGAGCSYELFRFPVEVDCDLSISTKLKFRDCATGVKATIEAKAITSANAANLVWNWECENNVPKEKKGKRFCLYDRPPGVYHLTVKDTVNGCWAEQTVLVPYECPPKSFPWKLILISMAVLAGILVMALSKKKKP
ncbi:MAG: hypothetical protein IPJ40_02850 [Saprospirales bacterium]|nr:hypothetical protein [Saprospirales bacterium]